MSEKYIFRIASAALLVYLKANLTGDEPFDVLRFASTHDQFPHDTTADQCYDSDQFAAYVQLGHHIAIELSGVLNGKEKSAKLNHRLWSVGTPQEKGLFRDNDPGEPEGVSPRTRPSRSRG